jgi:serine O-acetyltransferase
MLADMNGAEFRDYLVRQLEHFFPDGRSPGAAVADALDESLERLRTCINAVRMWKPDRFHHLQSEQNAIFLYYLSNTIWRRSHDAAAATKVFYLNKALNGFTCFYDTELPDRMFVGHSVGVVLARAEFSDYLVLYQGCTVGKNHGQGPSLGKGTVLYPGSSVIGRCRTGPRTVLGQNQTLIDADAPGDCFVFQQNGRPVFKRPSRDVVADIFRIEEGASL